MLRSRAFWEQRSLHPVARLLLVLAVGVLLCIAIAFILASGTFTRYDLLAVALYLSLAAFAWHPTIAAVVVMVISGVGVVFTGSGGDLLELAIALSLVAATCVPWVIVAHVALLGALTTYIALSGPTLAEGGVYGIAGIALIAFLAGIAFRLVAARETVLVAERARIAKDLEAIARHDQERIADELHDGIAHDLTLILFHARALPRQPDRAGRQVSLTTIEESAEQALQSIQSLLSLIRDTKTEGPRLRSTRYEGSVTEAVTSLGALLHDAGIPTSVATPSVPLGVATTAERVLTETAVEAVTNIIKHAPKSKSASIGIHVRPDAVELVVKNVAPTSLTAEDHTTGGRGLRRARQRLASSEGRLESERTPEGWSLRAVVPADPDSASEHGGVSAFPPP
ncbi:histidine kinase [Labedella phragmitis]|uniref:histidine kinase n=3 Tax=Labedella TaxID=390250 RepID=A0A444Q3V0_9MICO|nr:histidine kinase [Labedella phragmitis]RWZ51430.1 histidine kinase [Labedella phragmitis]RWZ58349.1 histidine kinase [Labedella populi]